MSNTTNLPKPLTRTEEFLKVIAENSGGGGGGATSYNQLSDLPSVDGNTIIGDMTFAELSGLSERTVEKLPNAVATSQNRPQNEIENMLSFDGGWDPLESLTADQIEAIYDGDMYKANFPVGTCIQVPEVSVTDEIASESVTYTETPKIWRYVGTNNMRMIFILDNYSTRYIVEGAEDSDIGEARYPVLAHVKYLSDIDGDSTEYASYGFGDGSATQSYTHMLQKLSDTIKDQFESFFNLESPYYLSMETINNAVAAKELSDRVGDPTDVNTTYVSDTSDPSFNYVQCKVGFLNSESIFGKQVLSNYMPKVVVTDSASDVSDVDFNVYNNGGSNSYASQGMQFPLMRYATRETSMLFRDSFFLDDKRMTAEYAGEPASLQCKEVVPMLDTMSMSLKLVAPTEIPFEGSLPSFIPFVVVSISEED